MSKFDSVGLNPMVRRQTPGSRFSHFEPQAGNRFTELLELIAGSLQAAPDDVQVLRPDGLIVKATLPEELCKGRFFSSVVALQPGMKLRSVFEKRQGGVEGEAPFMHTVVVGASKTPSSHVDVILYHRDALTVEERTWTPPGSDHEVVVEADWQVVSLNVRLGDKPEPPTPQAMARNMAAGLGMPEGKGGSAREYTAREFMEALLFWGSHGMVAGEDDQS